MFNNNSFEEDDNFHRKPTAEKMIRLLLDDVDVSPMLIDGKFGTGKTTFCKKSIDLIEKNYKDNSKPIKCAYIDAFTVDHANEPLITVIAAISKLIDNNLEKTLIEKTRGIVRFGLKKTLNVITSYALKASCGDLEKEISDILKSPSEECIKYTIDSLIKDHEEIENNISTLKNALTEITKNQQLIIFIDELDRCRPDFSIAIVECIKHVFDTPDIQFVLFANLEQIEAAIKKRYGSDVNAKQYLDKFIKFSFILPHEVANKNNSLATIEHAKNLIKNSGILKNSTLKINYISEFFHQLISQNSLSLREVEKFVRYLEVHYILSDEKTLDRGDVVTNMYILSVFIYIFKEGMRNKIINDEEISPHELSSLVGIQSYQSSVYDTYSSSPQLVAGLIHITLDSTIRTNKPSELDFWKSSCRVFFVNGVNPQVQLLSFFNDEFRKLGLQI